MTGHDIEKYEEAKSFLWSLKNLPPEQRFKNKSLAEQQKLRRQRMDFFLDLLGRPEKNLKFFHVTGTSGKGSVTSLIEAILVEAGFRTGGFLSPHITTELERIKFNGKFIPPGDFVRWLDYLKPYLTRCALEGPYGVPDFFEVILAISFLYFREKKCQYAVLEVGAGGENDPTNVIKNTVAAVITNVGLDHQKLLGKTKSAIARQKAGIIKKGCRFLTAEDSPAILKIFREACRQRRAVSFEKVSSDSRVVKEDFSGVEFVFGEKNFVLNFLGAHQAKNAALAISAVRGTVDDLPAIKRALYKLRLPARLEKVKDRPLVILDGAHNPSKMETTAAFAKRMKGKGKLILLIAVAGGKDAGSMFKKIVPLADRIFLTRFLATKKKSFSLKKLLKAARRLTKRKISVFIDPWQALDATLSEAEERDSVLITGSFFLAGELRKRWVPEKRILEKGEMF